MCGWGGFDEKKDILEPVFFSPVNVNSDTKKK